MMNYINFIDDFYGFWDRLMIYGLAYFWLSIREFYIYIGISNYVIS